MSTIEFDEKLNRQPLRFPNTGAAPAEVAQLAFVRRAVASSVLGRARALVLSGLLTCAVAAQEDNVEISDDADASGNSEISSSNAANNPAELKFTLQYWNYYAPSLNNLNGDAESSAPTSVSVNAAVCARILRQHGVVRLHEGLYNDRPQMR